MNNHGNFLRQTYLNIYFVSFKFCGKYERISLREMIHLIASRKEESISIEKNKEKNRIRKMASFKLGKEIEKKVFSSCHERGTKEKF